MSQRHHSRIYDETSLPAPISPNALRRILVVAEWHATILAPCTFKNGHLYVRGLSTQGLFRSQPLARPSLCPMYIQWRKRNHLSHPLDGDQHVDKSLKVKVLTHYG